MNPYYTVQIPYIADGATEWHPQIASGPFSTIVRGAFPTEREAIAWARKHLGGNPYRVQRIVDDHSMAGPDDVLHLVRGIRHAAEKVYGRRDTYPPDSAEWKALHHAAVALDKQANRLETNATVPRTVRRVGGAS